MNVSRNNDLLKVAGSLNGSNNFTINGQAATIYNDLIFAVKNGVGITENNMKFMGSVPIALIIASSLLCNCGCQTNRIAPINYSYTLTDQEIVEYGNEATRGDAAAALSLYRYYLYIKLDRAIGLKWLTLAAENGDPGAQYTMGRACSGEIYPDLTDKKRAGYWFERAARNGSSEAKEELGKLNPDK